MANKLLKLHMDESLEHEIVQLIDNLKSNLFFHGHPINRKEAKKDLKLKVTTPDEELEDKMWELYVQYERELRLSEPFNPLRELELKSKSSGSTNHDPISPEDLIKQMHLLAQGGIGLGQVTEEQLVKLAAAMVQFWLRGGCAHEGGARSNFRSVYRISGSH